MIIYLQIFVFYIGLLFTPIFNSPNITLQEGDLSVEEIILMKEKEAMERWRNGDPWGWAEISAKEITYIDPGLTKPISGLEEYKKYLQQFERKINYQISEFIDPKINRYGDLAILTYNYRSARKGTDGSILSETLWNTTEVYFWQNDQWKIFHTHWSFIKQKLSDSIEVPIPVEITNKDYKEILREVMRLESTAMELWRKGDPQGFLDICATDVTYFDTGTPKRLDGIGKLREEYNKRAGKIHYDVMEFIDPKVQLFNNSAVLYYRFFSTHLNPDGSIAKRIPWNCTEVYAKINGTWKIVHTHWSFINGKPL